MAYVITNQCIGCNKCLPVCPTGAISAEGTAPQSNSLQINPDLCNNCVSYYSVAQCAAACPTNRGCLPGTTSFFTQLQPITDNDEYWQRWFITYQTLVNKLETSGHTHYWEHWFDQYSQRLSHLIHSRNSPLSEAKS